MNTEFVHAEFQSLSIRIFSDGFSLWIKDIHQKNLFQKHIAYNHYQSINDFPELLMQQNETGKKFKNIQFLVEADFYDIIPASVFKPEHVNDLIHFRYPEITDQYKIISREFPGFGVFVINAIPENIYHFILSEFPDAQITFHTELILQEFNSASVSKVILFQRKRNVDMLMCKNQRIIVFNHFSYKTQEDIVYQVMNFLQTMNFNDEKYIMNLYFEEFSPALPQQLKDFCNLTESQKAAYLYENYKW